MQRRHRESLMRDHVRVSAIGLVLALFAVTVVVAPVNVADASAVNGLRASATFGLQPDALTPTPRLSPTSDRVVDSHVAGSGDLSYAVPVAAASIESDEVLIEDLSGHDSRASVSMDLVPLSTISLSGAQGVEGNSGVRPYTFTMSISSGADWPVCGRYRTRGVGEGNPVPSGGSLPTAESWVDFEPEMDAFCFYDAWPQTFNVNVFGDTAVESDEFFYFEIMTNPKPFVPAVYLKVMGVILNDDCQSDVTSYVSFGDATVAEGDSGTTTADFAVTLDPVNTCPVKIKMITSGVDTDPGATATPGEDYEHRTRDLTFAPGQASKTFSVTINGDTTVEFDEHFYIKYVSGSLVGAEPPEYAGVGIIVNDDGDCESDVTSYLSFGDATVAEGDSGTTTADFAVTLDPVSVCPVKVKVSTSGVGSAPNATATPGEDYEVASRYLTFDPGTTSKTFSVTINGDTTVELDEIFYIEHIAGSLIGAEPPGRDGVGTIVNDDDSDCESDVTSYLSVGDSTVTEGDDGTTTADFAVTLDPANACPVIVRYETCGVGCDPGATATPGEDFDQRTSDLTFAPGQTSKTFSVTINGDTTVELDETFFVRYVIDSATGVEPPENDGVGTIVNDDSSVVDTFVDDDDSMHEADIEWLVAEGITKGCATDPPRYCPTDVVRRSEMATFMIRAMGEDGNAPTYQGYFTDVPEGKWYTPYVERAYELDLTKGCDTAPLRYCPEGTVLRSEMAAFLVRQVEGDTNLPSYQAYFTDVPSGLWYTAYTERLYELGITNGCATNPARYCPTDPVLREQMAAFLHRTFG